MMYVYKLMDGDEVVYVGKTANPQQRVTQHRADKKFDRVFVSQCIEADRVEKELIGHYKPKYNCDFRNYDGSFVCLEWELLCSVDPFVKVPGTILASKDLSAMDKLLWSLLRSRNNYFKQNGKDHHDTLSAIADMLGVSDKTVERSLKTLIGCGMVRARKIPLSSVKNTRVKGVGGAMKWVFDSISSGVAGGEGCM